MTTLEFNDLVFTASKSLKYPALKFTRNNSEDADDLIQDTLLKALRNESKFKEGSNIKAWLFVIMRNTFISKYNNDKRNTYVDSTEDEFMLTTPGAIDYNNGASNIAISEIHKAIDKLEKVYKEPFMMHFAGFKYEEIAEKLDIPMGTVKNRIHVARKTLMSDLKDYNY
jgi:RNA polymerase sigma-70 factor (ECF subfamily)